MSSEPSFSTTYLNELVGRIRQGDRQAADVLLRGVSLRLRRLAHAMMRRYPLVRRWEDTDDLLQNATLRLLRALETVQPDNTRAFFALAALQLRRELIDLVRHYRGPEGWGANHASTPSVSSSSGSRPVGEPLDGADSLDDLDRWSDFHDAVQRLPDESREVVDLVFYHGWTQAQAAELLGVSERTVRRRWQSACVNLVEWLGDDLPLQET